MMGTTLARIKIGWLGWGLFGALLLVAVGAAGSLPTAAAIPPIAVQDSDVSGVAVALLDVKRTTGDTVTVRWEYRNTGAKPRELEKVGLNEADHYKMIAAAYVVDPANRKKYLIVRDSNNVPLGSRAANYRVPPNDTLGMWAKFPAPPANVQKISVYVPHAAPFEDVAMGK